MKNTTLKNLCFFALLFTALIMALTTASMSFATPMRPSYTCTPISNEVKFSAGVDGEITGVESLIIPASPTDKNPEFKLTVNGVRNIDKINNKTSPKKYQLNYSIKELKTPSLFELANQKDSTTGKNNDFAFDAIFIEYGSPDVISAGPLPASYNLKISMAFIASNVYFENPSPMTVKKVAFNCLAD